MHSGGDDALRPLQQFAVEVRWADHVIRHPEGIFIALEKEQGEDAVRLLYRRYILGMVQDGAALYRRKPLEGRCTRRAVVDDVDIHWNVLSQCRGYCGPGKVILFFGSVEDGDEDGVVQISLSLGTAYQMSSLVASR